MILYILKSAITMALLYSCFFVFLSKETFHRFNRCMLVGIMLVSLILPMFHFTTSHPTALNEEVYLMQNYIEQDSMEVTVRPQGTTHFTWIQLISWLYIAGVSVMLIVTLVQTFSLSRFLRNGVRHSDSQGNTIILHNQDMPPFSIFHYIVMSVKDYEENRPYILTHEQEHIRLGHTYDLLLLQGVKTLQWFSPFIWFLSRDLKAVHEYEADQAVINQGIDAKSYQQLLVTKVVGDRLQPFTNNLNHGSLKKRIIMMYQKKSNRWLMLKALCAIPVAALTISVFATPIETDPVEDMVKTLEKTTVPTLNEVKETILTTVENVDNTSFAIHPVRDQYGRILGFTHEGTPAAGDFECTYEYVFIDGRQATEAELKNYKNYTAFEILKTPNGTSEYNYKDKHGIICFTTDNKTGDIVTGNVKIEKGEPLKMATVSERDEDGKIYARGITDDNGNFSIKVVDPNHIIAVSYVGCKTQTFKVTDLPKNIVLEEAAPLKDVSVAGKREPNEVSYTRIEVNDEEPLILVNGIEIKFPADYRTLNDETIAKALNIKPEDVQGITVLKDGAATAIYGDRGKNGVIEIKVKPESLKLLQKLPGMERGEDGSYYINGKKVQKIKLDADAIRMANTTDAMDTCEEPAQYPGGQAAMMQYIATNVRYPKEAAENGIQGRMIVQFIIEKDGSLSNVNVVHNSATDSEGITVTTLEKNAKEKMEKGEEVPTTPDKYEACRKALEDEAVRVVKDMPKWVPAKQGGELVRMKYTLPITFRLQ